MNTPNTAPATDEVDYSDCDEWEMYILFGTPEEDEEI